MDAFKMTTPMPAGVAAPMVVYKSPFAIGDTVYIGHDDATLATVTGVMWKEELPQIEVSWMNNGSLQTAWVTPRLLRAEGAVELAG